MPVPPDTLAADFDTLMRINGLSVPPGRRAQVLGA